MASRIVGSRPAGRILSQPGRISGDGRWNHTATIRCDDRARHQGLDLGPRPPVPRVRPRRAPAGRRRRGGQHPRQRAGLGARCCAGADVRHRPRPDVGRHRVRLPRPRRPPALRRRLRADADRGRPALRELGPGRDRGRRALRPSRTPPPSGPSCRRRRGSWPTATTGPSPTSLDRPGLRSDGTAFTVVTLGRYHLHDVRAPPVGRAGRGPTRCAPTTSRRRVPRRHRLARRRAPAGARTEFAAALGCGRAGARDRQRGRSRRGAPRGARAPRAAYRRHPRASWPCCAPTATTPMCSTRCTDDLAAGARTTPCGPTPRCCTSRGPTCRSSCAARGGHPARAGCSRSRVKEGDGEGWSTHGEVELPRMFVYWRAEPLRAVLADAGWRVDASTTGPGHAGRAWLGRRSCTLAA